METINPHACREGFEQQRKAGINVDWFTWQIAWHDAMFTQVDCAPPPASTNRLTDALRRLEKACDEISGLRTREQYLSMIDSGQQDALLELDNARFEARAIIAATEAK